MSLVPLVLVLWAPLSAALHTSVVGLPSESFQLRSAPWLNGSRGFVTESGAVYRRLTADSLCDCMTQCFVDVGCVSLSFATNSTGLCLLNSVRGGPHNTRFDEVMAHRIRPRLAVLDDWCERDSDCTLLTTGPAECVESACRCSSGQQCASKITTSTVGTTREPSSTTGAGAASSSSSSAATIGSSATTASTSTTLAPTALSTAGTTTAGTTTTTTKATTTMTTRPTTTRPTTTRPTTSTTTTTTTTTSAAPPTITGMQKPDDTRRDTEGKLQSQFKYTWSCNADSTRGVSALVGLDIGGKDVDHVHGWACADFSSLEGFALDHTGKTYLDVQSGEYRCASNSVVVGFLDDHDKAHSVDRLVCVPVAGGYRVDCATPEQEHAIEKDKETYCAERHAVVGIAYDDETFKSMKCCPMVIETVAASAAG